MLTALRSHLTYANVMATIAVFIALGGSSYAVVRVGTEQLKNSSVTTQKLKNGAVSTNKVKNRAVTANKVTRNGLGGAVIDESKLGKVPSAAQADNASNATSAGNAAALAGLDAGAFERSTRIQYGRGPSGNGTSTLLFSWPEMGIEVRTDGDLLLDNQVVLRNTNPPGGSAFQYSVDGISGAFGALTPGNENETSSGPETARAGIFVTEQGEPGRSLWIRCFFNYFGGGDTQTRCLGIRSGAA